MNLNKLTKEQLVEHAKSLDISLDIESEKYELIDSLTKYVYTKCEGCSKKITEEFEHIGFLLGEGEGETLFVDDSYEEMYVAAPADRLSWPGVNLCKACYDEWSDVPKGFKLEVNPSTGGLWYRPLSKKDKSEIREDKLTDPGFMIGWWVKGSIIVLIILAIAQFL